MDIYFLGHSSFRLVGKKVSLVTDPFDSKMVGLSFPKVTADVVTVSHDHNDHNSFSQVEGVKKVISGPGEYEVSGVSVFGLPSFHDNQKGAERGANTIYVIEMDGLRLVHLGDLGHKLSESDVDALGEVDVLFVPVGGKYTIDHKEAADVVRAVEPNFIVPMHYKMPGMNEDLASELESVDPFVVELGIKKETMKKLTVKEALTGEEQVVVLLEAK